jgi:hypothetical protein
MLVVAGCSLFHHDDSPQQKFMQALKHGDGPAASRIWLNLDAEDRANLSHGIGVTPQISPQEVQTQLLRHEMEKGAVDDAASSGEAAPPLAIDVERGDLDSKIVEMPGLDLGTGAGELQNLPNIPATLEPAPASW